MATPGYFTAMGIALRQGRLFDQHDDLDAKRVALVNEAMVRKHFAHENPLGRRIVMGGKPLEIVGVVADAKLYGLDAPVEPAIYMPHMQRPSDSMGVVVRTEGDPGHAGRRGAPRDPEARSGTARLERAHHGKVLSDSLMLRRVSMLLLAVFASLALTLATVGIYGLTAYSVSRRTHEIGLRVALGAEPAADSAPGGGPRVDHFADRRRHRGGRRLPVDAALSGMLYGVTATDPLVFAGVPLLLIAVSVIGQLVPARKAMRDRSAGGAAL